MAFDMACSITVTVTVSGFVKLDYFHFIMVKYDLVYHLFIVANILNYSQWTPSENSILDIMSHYCTSEKHVHEMYIPLYPTFI